MYIGTSFSDKNGTGSIWEVFFIGHVPLSEDGNFALPSGSREGSSIVISQISNFLVA